MAAPVVTPVFANQGVGVGDTVQPIGFFTVSDGDGDPITYYFYDQDVGGGYFTVNGVVQAAQTSIQVTAGSLSTVAYHAGDVAAVDTIWLKASDGALFSPWQSAQIYSLPPTSVTPGILVEPAKNILQNEWHQFS